MKKIFAVILALTMVFALTAVAASAQDNVYSVAYLVNGNLGDKSFFDSAEAGLEALAEAGRIDYITIEMGGTDEDQPTWLSTLYDVSESEEYDVIICGTYQMPDYLKEVATAYPDQKYIIFDDNTYVGENQNVLNLTYKQNDMGYLVGTFAACMTTDTSLDKINPEAVVGFVGGVDSPVINDFLTGFIEGALAVNADIKVDTRYTNDYVDTAIAKEYGLSMINDNKCDIVWGVAGNAGNGAAEAALETGKAWFIGVDSDQELTFSPDLAADIFHTRVGLIIQTGPLLNRLYVAVDGQQPARCLPDSFTMSSLNASDLQAASGIPVDHYIGIDDLSRPAVYDEIALMYRREHVICRRKRYSENKIKCDE